MIGKYLCCVCVAVHCSRWIVEKTWMWPRSVTRNFPAGLAQPPRLPSRMNIRTVPSFEGVSAGTLVAESSMSTLPSQIPPLICEGKADAS